MRTPFLFCTFEIRVKPDILISKINLVIIFGSLLFGNLLFPQTPAISYTTPNTFLIGEEIAPLIPTNSGGAILIGNLVTTFSGLGTQGSVNGSNAVATYRFPTVVITDLNGNVIVVDRSNHLIRKITPEGIVSTIAGTGTAGTTDGPVSSAKFNFPDAAVVDSNGNIFITDQSNHKIRKISPDGVVSTIAGSGMIGSNDGIGTEASFHFPAGIAIDGAGDLYVADFGNHKIRKVTQSGEVTTFAGTGTAGNQDGTLLSASFNGLTSVELDDLGNFFVADYYNHTIRKIDANGNVTTFAGSGIAGALDGNGILAQFKEPATISIDEMNELYIADQGNNKIRKITQAGEVSTYAGTGIQGFQNGTALQSRFNAPTGLTISEGIMYVCDYQNHRIRKVKNYAFSISSDLPLGLTFDTATGIISGAPTELFSPTDFIITAENAAGISSTVVSIAVEEALSTPGFLFENIKISPNPFSNQLKINALDEIQFLQLFDCYGKEIDKKIANQNQINWQLSGLSTGFYFIKVTTLTSQNVVKIFKN